jgi:outer membrane receptor protein involved in Fe transport
VFRAPSGIPGVVGPITSVIIPDLNFTDAIGEGLDYEATYILESSMFGHGDFGRLTATVNGTWVSRIEFQAGANSKPGGIAGFYFLGNGFPWHRANFSLYYDGPTDTWMQGLDAGAVVHWIGQYNDDNITLASGRARKIAAWTTLDLIASYTFNLPRLAPPAPVPGFAKDGGKNVNVGDSKENYVMPVSTAEYNRCGWRAWFNNTTISFGIQNVLDEDPPFAAGSIENGYDESLFTIKGRFCYVQVKKRF